MKCLKNARTYVEGKGIVYADIVYDKRFVSIAQPGEGATEGCTEEIADLPSDCIVIPAFIDEHIHGANGSDVMDGTEAALGNICNALCAEGTARFLATTMTASEGDTLAALYSIRNYMASDFVNGAALLGVHIEGPFISKARAGAQPVQYIRQPDLTLFDRLDNACGGNIRMMTVAPELACAAQLISYATSRGVVCSVGHTDCKFDDVRIATTSGAHCVTHTYNAQSPFTHREAGAVGAALLTDRLFCELIADGVHVSLPAVQLLIANKPKDKIVLITDAMRAKGKPEGVSELGGQKVIVKNGEAHLENGTLAGSVLKMNDAVRFLVERAGMSFTDAVDCASLNAAKNLGADGDYGSIKEGKFADFTVLTKNFEVVMTVRDGRLIYKK